MRRPCRGRLAERRRGPSPSVPPSTRAAKLDDIPLTRSSLAALHPARRRRGQARSRRRRERVHTRGLTPTTACRTPLDKAHGISFAPIAPSGVPSDRGRCCPTGVSARRVRGFVRHRERETISWRNLPVDSNRGLQDHRYCDNGLDLFGQDLDTRRRRLHAAYATLACLRGAWIDGAQYRGARYRVVRALTGPDKVDRPGQTSRHGEKRQPAR
jgi:hypothetical protein